MAVPMNGPRDRDKLFPGGRMDTIRSYFTVAAQESPACSSAKEPAVIARWLRRAEEGFSRVPVPWDRNVVSSW